MSLALFFRLLARESRGLRARLYFFTACLAAGVAAVVAVAGLTSGLEEGIRVRARELLAADLVVSARRPLPEELDSLLASMGGLEWTHTRELVTVVAAPARNGAPGRSQLVELKVVEGRYPFYGRLELEPALPLSELLGPGAVVVGSELLSRLQLAPGDQLKVGEAEFEIAGEVRAEPDRINFSLTLGPRVFLSGEGFERTALEKQGSNLRYRTLVRQLPGSLARDARELERRLRRSLSGSEYVRIDTYSEAQPTLRRGIERVGSFLGLVALLSLFIGGIGVAGTVRAWIASRLDAIAIEKCLGLRPREVLLLHLGQAVWLALAGSLLGAAGGALLELLAARWLGDLVPPDLIRPWQPSALARGLGLGLGVAVLFSLAPLLTTLSVPPARVLRRDADPLPAPRGLRAALAVAVTAGMLATAWLQSGSLDFAMWFTAGCLVLAGLLALAARALISLAGRLPRERLGVLIRYGVAALARPGAGTVGAIVALGLGVLVVLGLYLVQARLANELETALPPDAPSAFLIDVQPAQWPAVRSMLEDGGARNIDSVPVVVARLSHIDGRSVEDLSRRRGDDGSRGGESSRRNGRPRRVLTREQRLTYLSELPADNRVIEGALWSDPERAEISLEQEFAEDLEARLGTRLTFDVQGVPIELLVTSLRSVEWRSFGLNFFLVVEPGVLEDAPQFRVAAARLADGSEQLVQDRLAAECPNVTMIGVRMILEKVGGVLARVGLGVRVLGGFTVLAGIAILFGAVSAGSVRRSREVALFKTLGMTRAEVVGVFGVEYVLIGATAGSIGAAGASVLAWAVVTRWLDLGWSFDATAALAGIVATATLSALAGLAASGEALSRSPVEVLRVE